MESAASSVERIVADQLVRVGAQNAILEAAAEERGKVARGYQRLANALLTTSLGQGSTREVAAGIAKLLRGRWEAPISLFDLADACGRCRNTCRAQLRRLVELGALELVSAGGGNMLGQYGRHHGRAGVYRVTALWLVWFPPALHASNGPKLRARTRSKGSNLCTFPGVGFRLSDSNQPTLSQVADSPAPDAVSGTPGGASPAVAAPETPEPEAPPSGQTNSPARPVDGPPAHAPAGARTPLKEQEDKPHPETVARHALVAAGYPPSAVEAGVASVVMASAIGKPAKHPARYAVPAADIERDRLRRIDEATERKCQAEEASRRRLAFYDALDQRPTAEQTGAFRAELEQREKTNTLDQLGRLMLAGLRRAATQEWGAA